MNIRRKGNSGFIETGNGDLISFSIGSGWDSSAPSFISSARFQRKIHIHGYDIVPMGDNNRLPEKVAELMDNFYAGEGILGKIRGLQYGRGPKMYVEDFVDNKINRTWINPPADQKAWLDYINIKQMSLRCLTDLTHMEGFFWKGYLAKGHRIGRPRFIQKIEHVPFQKCRLVYPPEGFDEPQSILVGDWPNPDPTKLAQYPIFDPNDPFKHEVFMGYENIYSFCKDFISTPRYLGAFEWIGLAGTIAGLLRTYNSKASALSLHIESPQTYWDDLEDKLKKYCATKNIEYTLKMLEDYKDKAFMEFTAGITGEKNVGSFLHTQLDYDDVSNTFVGWKVTPIDKKIKEYIDSQIAIADKSNEAAATSFGLDPVLANLVFKGNLSSGSEKLYSYQVYNVSETAIPEMVMFDKVNCILNANFKTINQIGFYHTPISSQQEVAPKDRMKNEQ